jgi:HlyD family secretion protein
MASGTRVRVWVDGAGEFVGQVRFVASEAAFTPYFSLTEHDADRLSYLAEIDIEDGAELPSGVPVRVAAPIREE